MSPPVRTVSSGADRAAAAELLHAFNVEFGDPTPPPDRLAARLATLPDTVVLLAGDPAVGVAVVRYRPDLWTEQDEAYLAELYVVPAQRGRGLGRALLTAVLDAARARGASRVELGTGTDDKAARALYESAGFTNTEGPGGASMLVYALELGFSVE